MEETTPTPSYLKGFNEGYIMAKESPNLADSLSRIQSDNERIKGFTDGHRQFVLDKAREQRRGRTTPQPLKEERERSPDYDIDKE